MPYTTHADGALEITPARTTMRVFVAIVMASPLVLAAMFLLAGAVYSRVWTLSGSTITVLAFGLVLNPVTWAALILFGLLPMWWDGTVVLERDGHSVVSRRLMWGKSISHRVDLERMPGLTVSVQHYPRDNSDSDWRTSFRPRVVVMNGGSRVMSLGGGLSLSESIPLAAAIGELIG